MNYIDIEEVLQKQICAECITEDYLALEIKTNGKRHQCSYCRDVSPTLSMKYIIERVHGVVRNHFRRTPVDPDILLPEGYDRPGDFIGQLLEDLVDTTPAIAEEIRAVLNILYGNYDPSYPDEGEYDEDSQYEETPVDLTPLTTEWEKLVKLIKGKKRDKKQVESILNNIFTGISDVSTYQKVPVVTVIEPRKNNHTFFRARVFTDSEKLLTAIAHPDIELGTPIPEKARSGRMNKRGVPVFYGSMDADTAIREVRPPVGCNVGVAQFIPIKKMQVLNLAMLEQAYAHGSYFDLNEQNKKVRVGFLRRFCELVTMPVMPGDEEAEYLITQVVAEYLDKKVGLDGIIFPSVQSGKMESHNIVLFNKVATVEKMVIPKATKIRTTLCIDCREADYYKPYSVTEIRPTDSIIDITMEPNPNAGLRILPHKITIHKITGASYSHNTEPVERTVRHPYNDMIPGWGPMVELDDF